MERSCRSLWHAHLCLVEKDPEKGFRRDEKWTHTCPPAALAQRGPWLRMEQYPAWKTNGNHTFRAASGPEGPQGTSDALGRPTALHRGICREKGRKQIQLVEFLTLRIHLYSFCSCVSSTPISSWGCSCNRTSFCSSCHSQGTFRHGLVYTHPQVVAPVQDIC